jgi:hypothetical protein
LRAPVVGLLAFVLVTQALAAATKAPAESPRNASSAQTGATAVRNTLTLEEQFERKSTALRKARGAVRFFRTHRMLLSNGGQRGEARSSLASAERRVRRLSRTVEALRTMIRKREARRLAALPPKAAICTVFGRYCHEAVDVAWCESRLDTTARNGQYLGLFQMGARERSVFGHGPTAHEQAVAAHHYFVRSGRNWSPWGCRWAAS